MEEKKEKTQKQKPIGDAKNETVEEVTVRQADEMEVVADEVSEDAAKKPTKAKRNGKRRRNNKTETQKENASKSQVTDASENAAEADEEQEKGKSSGSSDSSTKALELELERQQAMLEEADERYKRLLAEFDNARNRYEKDSKHMYDVGAKEVLEKLLPVVDNFERALQTIAEEDRERAFEQGVDKIYKQLMITLEEIGVKPMNAEGTQFDPNLHNAVMHVEDENFDENVVAEELQKGYLYKEDVLRHSMVKVAN